MSGRSLVTLPTDLEVTGLILCSIVRFFSNGELFHGIYDLCLFVFFNVQPFVVFGGSNCARDPIYGPE